jgi:DNA repair exonuclease SbcCD nuclease subunit
MYCIPGQHDLPDHNYEDIGRSAYYTLVQAEKIQNVLPGALINISSSQITIYGFPFGHKLKLNKNESKFIQIAMIHEYCWIKGHSYPGAPEENKFGKRKAGIDKNNKWLGYDIVIYGDNHKGFYTQIGETEIFNCGTLMRRKSDEINYKPQVGLIYSDGSVEPYYLDTSLDKYLDVSETKDTNTELDISSFIEELSKLGEAAFDFSAAIKQYFAKHKTNKNVKNVILKAMENRK